MFLVPLIGGAALLVNAALAFTGYRGRRPALPGAGCARPERILVVGATGGTGRQIVAQALERGYAVTALARDPARVAITHDRLTVLRGDVMDAASLDAALVGQEAVLSALGHRRYFDTRGVLSRGTSHLLGAMTRHGVSRYVGVTSLGLGDSVGRLGLFYSLIVVPFVLPVYFLDKARQERIVAASDREWTLVRPGALTDGPARQPPSGALSGGNFLWTVSISRADVAGFMLDQLETTASRRSVTP